MSETPTNHPDLVPFPQPARPDGARPRVLAVANQKGGVGKKANFLREVVRELGLPAKVHQERAEKFGESFAETVHVVTARALAPLKVLCDQAFPLIAKGAVGLFPKGQDVAAELTEAAKYWRLEASTVPSATNPASSIVALRSLRKLTNPRR